MVPLFTESVIHVYIESLLLGASFPCPFPRFWLHISYSEMVTEGGEDASFAGFVIAW